jgi:hypothetical protein
MMPSKEEARPSKSDRPESSVLFSLKELRRLEDDRRAQERRAKAEAEQRTRDEEARRAREEEERRQRVESEREARQREDRIRVEEAERRARVEGELKLREQLLLEEQRQRQVQGRHLRRSTGMAAAAAGLLFVALGGGLAVWASRQHQAEKNALEREIARRDEQARAAQLAADARIRALEENAHRYPGEVKPPKDPPQSPGDLQRQKQVGPRPARRTTPPMQPAAAPPPSPFRVPQKPQIPNEPLGGLPDIKSGGF